MDRGLEFDWGKPAKVSYEMLVFQFIT
jgi:hypothetical protein